jgi:hypothetical protein
LGPLIFLIFINELPLYIKNGLVTIFADDTSVVVSAPNKNDLDTLIEETMEDMRWWCARNKLVLNINKTVVLKFSRTHPLQSAKFLGRHIDSQLNWIEQPNTICSRLNSTYYAKNRETHLYNTRFNNNLRSLSHRTAMYERSPSYSCTSTRIFNKLPTNIKTASTLQKFKKLLRSWLIGKCFYSLNEFYNA